MSFVERTLLNQVLVYADLYMCYSECLKTALGLSLRQRLHDYIF